MNPYTIITDYIRYYFSSKTKHGIHSPFVFEFVTQILEQKSHPSGLPKQIEQRRKELLKSEKDVHIVDLGAGSQLSQQNTRKVRDIVKNSAKKKKYALLIYKIIGHYKLQSMLELGTSAGISSMYMAAAAPHGKVTTIEGCPDIAALAKENFDALNITNISQITGNFDHVLADVLHTHPFDCIFFDGNHKKDATIRYFEQCLPYVTNNSIFIFDDINWSEEMKEAWAYIKAHPSVHVTIDLFFLGIVFFRKELSKENFVIRY